MEPNILEVLRKLSLAELEQLLDAVTSRSIRMHFEALGEALGAREGGGEMKREGEGQRRGGAGPFRAVLPLLLLLVAWPAQATEVTVDAARQRRAISDDLYGLLGGEDAQLARMGATVRRLGGNTLSRYNWKSSATNTGGDIHFFKIQQLTPADDLVSGAQKAGAATMIELPMLGYVSRALMSGGQRCGFSVAKYGAQQSTDPADPDCGNGMTTAAQPIANDPNDISLPATEGWAKEWVMHLVGKFGQGGVRYYNLGNQPALWHQTHRDVHPARASYAEIKAKLYAYGEAVKSADPKALTLGPAAWGWLEYFDSAAGDRASAGIDFIPFYLRAAKDYEATRGKRILDFLDIHIYPQATGVTAGLNTPEAKAQRLRSTRILWDPGYTVESWETCCHGNGTLRILPRMREWIDGYYPGTKLAVSGYGWGAIDTPNGALAQADVLGIFGREGVAVATLEVPPQAGSVGEDAFRLYRNYDGQGRRFGNTSVRTTTSAPGGTDAYGAFADDGRVTVVVINKDLSSPDTVKLTFEGMGKTGPWRAFEFGASGRLAPAGGGQVTDGTVTKTIAAQTATLIEFLPAGGIGPPSGDLLPPTDADAGTGAGTPGVPGVCGCSAGGTSQLLLLLALLVQLKPRRRNER